MAPTWHPQHHRRELPPYPLARRPPNPGKPAARWRHRYLAIVLICPAGFAQSDVDDPLPACGLDQLLELRFRKAHAVRKPLFVGAGCAPMAPESGLGLVKRGNRAPQRRAVFRGLGSSGLRTAELAWSSPSAAAWLWRWVRNRTPHC